MDRLLLVPLDMVVMSIAILLDHVLRATEKLELKGFLEQALLRDVDLVDLSELSKMLLKQIMFKGRVVINVDPSALAELYKRIIYNHTDMVPYVVRTIEERQQRFING